MRYREWDPLQLSYTIDSGIRVVKQSVSFNLFRTYRHKITWTPMIYSNFGLFYGKIESQKEAVVELFAEQSKKFHQSVHIGLFTFGKSSGSQEKEVWNGLEDKYKAFFHHPFEQSLEELLALLIRLRNEIEEKSIHSRMIEPSNKVLQFIFLDLGEKEIEELKNPKVQEMLEDLLHNSYFQRMYVGVLAKNADSLNHSTHDLFQFAAYLGKENDEYCRDIHKDADESEFSRQQILIGTAWTRDSNRMINLHPLKFTPNEKFIQAQQRFEEEDKAYIKFLNSLDDGTDKMTEVEK